MGIAKCFIALNVNCADLFRTRLFYELVGQLQPRPAGAPIDGADRPRDGISPRQDGYAFGFYDSDCVWHVSMAGSKQQLDGAPQAQRRPFLNMLEWRLPAPKGPTYDVPNHLGIERLFLTAPDISGHYERVKSAGVNCVSDPQCFPALEPSTMTFAAVDPDRTKVQFVEGESQEMHSVTFNVSNLERSVQFYTELLGLEIDGRSEVSGAPGTVLGVEGEVAWKAYHLKIPSALPGTFRVNLVEWKKPAPVGNPYKDANNLGLYRLSFGVDDVDDAYHDLRRKGVQFVTPPYSFTRNYPPNPIGWARFVLLKDPDDICLVFEPDWPARLPGIAG